METVSKKTKDVTLNVAVDPATVNPSESNLKNFALPVDGDNKLGVQPVILIDPTTGKAFGAANPLPITLI